MQQPVEKWNRGENLLRQQMLFECMGICVLSPASECEMKGSLVYLLIAQYSLILFKSSHRILDRLHGLVLEFVRDFEKQF